MLEIVSHYDALATAQYGILNRTLTNLSEVELDWHIHPQANTLRWLLGHQLWYEAWVPDAIETTGRFLEDTGPESVQIDSLEAFTEQFGAAQRRRQAVYDTVTAEGLAREFSYLGKATYTVEQLIRTHAAHFTGHSYQIRMIRGVYSRAHKTDKAVFDPW